MNVNITIAMILSTPAISANASTNNVSDDSYQSSFNSYTSQVLKDNPNHPIVLNGLYGKDYL